jgi:flavodoxin
MTMSGKCLVVYYSKGGNTKTVAQAVAKRMGGELCEVNEQGVAQPGFDPSAYGLVVIGTPVNGFSTSLPIQGYLTQNKGKLPAVAFYATYSLHPMGTLGGMEKLAGKKPVATEKFKSSDIKLGKIDAKVDGFVAALKK